MREPFIKVGERVRFIGTGKHRRGDWPEGKWLEYGVPGVVTEYHPEQPTVIVKGERFEALPPYAVVTWDLGGAATSVIDPEDEGKRWERIEGPRPRAVPQTTSKEGKYIWLSRKPKFMKNVPVWVQKRILSLVDQLPANVDLSNVEFEISKSMLGKGELGIYHPRLRRINLRTVDFTDDTFFHEVGHYIFSSAIDRRDTSFLEQISPEFARWLAKRITELRQLHPEASRIFDSELLYKFDIPFRDIEESFVSVFSAYVRGLEIEVTGRPELTKRLVGMLEKMFPKQVAPEGHGDARPKSVPAVVRKGDALLQYYKVPPSAL